MWKFDGTDWTWISGSNIDRAAPVYGMKGVPNAQNVPGARSAGVFWVDFNENVWVFGGSGRSSSTCMFYVSIDVSVGTLNDLWRFDGSMWTWVSGLDTAPTTPVTSIYGIKGVAAPNNYPSSHSSSAIWLDDSGNMFMFGGFGVDANGINGIIDDLWKFDGNMWTWVAGSRFYDAKVSFGDYGVANTNFTPGARSFAAYWIVDNILYGWGGYVGSNCL